MHQKSPWNVLFLANTVTADAFDPGTSMQSPHSPCQWNFTFIFLSYCKYNPISKANVLYALLHMSYFRPHILSFHQDREAALDTRMRPLNMPPNVQLLPSGRKFRMGSEVLCMTRRHPGHSSMARSLHSDFYICHGPLLPTKGGDEIRIQMGGEDARESDLRVYDRGPRGSF
jgi:hypothetical protein